MISEINRNINVEMKIKFICVENVKFNFKYFNTKTNNDFIENTNE